jgi:ABC-type uncharacterized transport system permease subunit
VALFLKISAGLMLVSLTVALAHAQGKVNFSGTWILDKSQSEVSQLVGMSEDQEKLRDAGMTMVVDQQGANLRVTRVLKTSGEESKEIHSYKTDGGETTNTGFRGETVVARAFWERDKLVVVSTRTRKALLKDITVESRGVWSLSPDGKTLTIAVQVYNPREQRVKAVFDKQ